MAKKVPFPLLLTDNQLKKLGKGKTIHIDKDQLQGGPHTLLVSKRKHNRMSKNKGKNMGCRCQLEEGEGILDKRTPGVYPPKVRNMLKKIGNDPITSLYVVTTPLGNTQIINYLTLGAFEEAIKNSPYDKMVHLSLLINETYTFQKESVINLTKDDRRTEDGAQWKVVPLPTTQKEEPTIEPAKKQKPVPKIIQVPKNAPKLPRVRDQPVVAKPPTDKYGQPITNTNTKTKVNKLQAIATKGKGFGTTINEFIDKGHQLMGDPDFTDYDVVTNNCQRFVTSCLKANGLLTHDLSKFINQDVQSIYDQLPWYSKAVTDFATDLEARLDRLIEGEGLDNIDLKTSRPRRRKQK
jgi:hypothetical protein